PALAAASGERWWLHCFDQEPLEGGQASRQSFRRDKSLERHTRTPVDGVAGKLNPRHLVEPAEKFLALPRTSPSRARGCCRPRGRSCLGGVEFGVAERLNCGFDNRGLGPLAANYDGVRPRLKELRRGPEDLPRGSNDCPCEHAVRTRATPDAKAKWDLLAQHEHPLLRAVLRDEPRTEHL